VDDGADVAEVGTHLKSVSLRPLPPVIIAKIAALHIATVSASLGSLRSTSTTAADCFLQRPLLLLDRY